MGQSKQVWDKRVSWKHPSKVVGVKTRKDKEKKKYKKYKVADI